MWKPEAIGDVIAERAFTARRPSGRKSITKVRFGRPIRGVGVSARDPWWCPVEVRGAGLDSFRPVAGIDSLQSLILALELVTRVLPTEAARAGLRIEWLGDAERLVLARHVLSREAESSLLCLFGALREASSILALDHAQERRATDALRAIVKVVRPGGNSGRIRRRRGKSG
jgi:hypothetical protein